MRMGMAWHVCAAMRYTRKILEADLRQGKSESESKGQTAFNQKEEHHCRVGRRIERLWNVGHPASVILSHLPCDVTP
jgi:hypothetical protein